MGWRFCKESGQKMELKTMKKTIILICCVVFCYICVHINISQNAIYYAVHQPKVGDKDRTLFEIYLHGHEGKVPESLTIFDIDDGNFIGVVNNGYRLNPGNCLLSRSIFLILMRMEKLLPLVYIMDKNLKKLHYLKKIQILLI